MTTDDESTRPARDPALQKLLLTAADERALEKLRLFELLRKTFRVTVAGLDVTDFPGPPAIETELQRAREVRALIEAAKAPPSKRALRRKRAKRRKG